MESYFPEIDRLVAEYAVGHPHRVFVGDTQAFTRFKTEYTTYLTPEQGEMGTFYLHPNPQGAALLGESWGKAIDKALRDGG
jgi:hypothetical protein